MRSLPLIDPDALEVRIRVQRPGKQGRPHDGGDAARPVAIETGEKKLTGKLLEALSLLCQAGKKFMSCMGESQQQMIEPVDLAEAPGEAALGERGGPVMRDKRRMPETRGQGGGSDTRRAKCRGRHSHRQRGPSKLGRRRSCLGPERKPG